jgi:hypothetical protein
MRQNKQFLGFVGLLLVGVIITVIDNWGTGIAFVCLASICYVITIEAITET